MSSPIVLIGMHRSGTSMLAKLLERMGLFLGSDLETHHESLSFISANTWVMRECGGAWDYPRPVQKTLSHVPSRDGFADYVRATLGTLKFASFMGWKRWLRHQNPMSLPQYWGWKDPRTTITLPMWTEIFPSLKVVSIQRHGVDVARSLHVRQLKRRSPQAIRDKVQRLRDRLSWRSRTPFGRQFRLPGSDRCRSAEGSFSLWEIYEKAAATNLSQLDAERKVQIRFEELLSRPCSILSEVASFVGLKVSRERLEGLVQDIDERRAYAFRDDPHWTEFAVENEERLKTFGYSR